MNLFDIYEHDLVMLTLATCVERQDNPYLSHFPMPTFEEQEAYVHSRPHKHWYAAWAPQESALVGWVFNDPVQCGVAILNAYHRRGYGFMAMLQLLTMLPQEPFTAYIHPENEASLALHRKLGFELTGSREDGYQQWVA